MKYVQEQIEAAKGRDIHDFASGSDETSDEEDEVRVRLASKLCGAYMHTLMHKSGRILYGRNRSIAAGEAEDGTIFIVKVTGLAKSPIVLMLKLRAKARIARQRIEVGLPLGKIVNVRKEVFGELKVRSSFVYCLRTDRRMQTFNNLGSQFGDDRPLSTVRFSPDSKLVLTTSWTGDAKLWDLPNLNAIGTKRGHTDKVGGSAWHPTATVGMSAEGVNIATGGGEGDVKLWSLAA